MGSNLRRLKRRTAPAGILRSPDPGGKEISLCLACCDKMNVMMGTVGQDGDGSEVDMKGREEEVIEMIAACPTCSKKARVRGGADDKSCTRCLKEFEPPVPSTWATLLSFRGKGGNEQVKMWATLCPACIGAFITWIEAAPAEAAAPN